jgi:phosphoribosyl 1,2-cyclic phosphate phosphodiesterase
MIEVGGKAFVIDTGPDFRQQMLRQGVKKLDAVILTHGHKDHIAGLDDVRAFNYVQRRAMDIYARKEVNADVEREFSYAFTDEKYPGVPEMNLHNISNDSFTIEGIEIVPVEVIHFELKIFGYRIQDFVYITDASKIEAKEIDKVRGSKVLVINGLRKSPHYSHFNLEQALELIRDVQPDLAYITHISHQMGFYDEVSKELPEGVFLAYDGLEITIS